MMIQELLAIIAQTPGNKPQSSGTPLFIGLILMIGVFYIVLLRGNRKQKHDRKSMLESIKNNDRVMTIGGVIGTVVAVRENDVVLKVDESTNTKMTFIKKSVQQVLTDGDLATANQ